MQWERACAISCLLGQAILGQAESGLRDIVASVRYPTLAEYARIQGDVRLEINHGVVKLVSGHPLLARLAMNNAEMISSARSQLQRDITYHFILVDVDIIHTSTTVSRGNSFERLILRVLGLKTVRVVHEYKCEAAVVPQNEIKTTGAVVEVWIYGTTHCLQTDSATLVAKR